MTIDETIAELQRLRDFVNPNAEVVGDITLDSYNFNSVTVRSINEMFGHKKQSQHSNYINNNDNDDESD